MSASDKVLVDSKQLLSIHDITVTDEAIEFRKKGFKPSKWAEEEDAKK